MSIRWVVLLLLAALAWGPAGAEPLRPQRAELQEVLARKLDPDQSARIKGMLDAQFDPQHELSLTPSEQADLKALFGDVAGEFKKRYPHGLQDWVWSQLPLPVPPPPPAAAPAKPGN